MGSSVLKHTRLFAFCAFFVAVGLIVAIAFACFYYGSTRPSVIENQTAGFSTKIDPNRVLPCDGNKDKRIDEADLAILKMYWKGFPEPSVDCNDDGMVHTRDLSILLTNWTQEIPELLAAPESVEPDTIPADLKPGDRFTASVLLTSGAIPLGAGEVALHFNPRKLSVRSVQTSSGIWSTWIERPRPPYGSKLVFAGGRVGGFTGDRALIAEVEFEVMQTGDFGLSVDKGSVAYQLDSAGAPSTMAKFGLGMRGGTISASNEASRYSATVTKQMEAVSAPTRTGPLWIIDLAMLAPNEQIVAYYITYEVAEGYSRSVQNEDIYPLRNVEPGAHSMYVLMHDSLGNQRQVKAAIHIP